ncbi:MAG: hypothetical protein JXA68_00515 [Ignavibacteriales bacterium]|nr:hypothetical protein [Ignavibacteriales bacterium]
MKTLVYFASGPIREEYKDIDFNKIYLIDNCFSHRRSKNLLANGKIECIGMDCLESITLLKKENVQIDYFVSLNEGLYEGGGSYAINSDMFLGYVMPLLKERYIHIMNLTYYRNQYRVTMDLPYKIEEIKENDPRYLNPFIFSRYKFSYENAKVFEMRKIKEERIPVNINSKINIQIIHESIWNYYEELDIIIISFSEQGQQDFFDKIPKTININRLNIDEVFIFCEKNRIKKLGFTPWGKGKYKSFLNKLKILKSDYPKEIYLFHLNKNDYKEIKEFAKRSS